MRFVVDAVATSATIAGLWSWTQRQLSVLYWHIITIVVAGRHEQRVLGLQNAASAFGIGKTTSTCEWVETIYVGSFWKTLVDLFHVLTGII